MSFILDALKKSENKRRKKSAQLPPSIHEPVAYKIARPRSWALWILALLAVNALLLTWLLGLRFDAEPEADVVTAESAVVEGVPAEVRSAVESAEPPAEKAAVVPEPKVQEKIAAEVAVVDGIGEPVTASDSDRIYRLMELPQAIRRQIPELKMSLHAFNREERAAGLVQLNNRIYREGDKIGAMLKLDEITAEGAILRYNEYRFLLPRRGE